MFGQLMGTTQKTFAAQRTATQMKIEIHHLTRLLETNFNPRAQAKTRNLGIMNSG
jgi:hypothetical protein